VTQGFYLSTAPHTAEVFQLFSCICPTAPYFFLFLFLCRMATLLSKFRIDFSDITVLGDVNTKPKKEQ